MALKSKADLKASEEQLRYAEVLEKGMFIGLLVLLVTFIIYAFGILEPHVPFSQLSSYWKMNVEDYLHHARIEAGWSWLAMLNEGDMLNFLGIAILAGVTIVCYVAIIPILLKHQDMPYVVMAVLEVFILALAASGILAVGH